MSDKEIEPKNALPKELREMELKEKVERAGNEAYKLSAKRKWIERGVLVLSGIVYSLAFPSWNLAFIGWAALIPIFLIALKKTPWQAWRAGYLWGFSWSVAAFFWLGEIESFNPPFRALVLWTQKYFPSFNGGFCLPWLMALILALFTAFWAMFVPILRKGLLIPLEIQLKGSDAEEENFKISFFKEIFFVFALASCWCILEWVRTWIATGLPWNFLAATQWKNRHLRGQLSCRACQYFPRYGIAHILENLHSRRKIPPTISFYYLYDPDHALRPYRLKDYVEI
jgi:apolipoprotein N-acyltransferase